MAAEFYKSVTRFVKRQSARAAAAGDDPRARAVGFLMALYQRRLASSTRAVCCSLENRARRLDVGLNLSDVRGCPLFRLRAGPIHALGVVLFVRRAYFSTVSGWTSG
jgi:hypothetical protein